MSLEMKREEVILREQERKKRLAILEHSDKLNKVCESCDIRKGNHAEEQNYYLRLCTECPIYHEHRKIGNSLMALSKARKKRNGVDVTATARRNLGLKLGANKVVDNVLVTTNELELDEYYKLKAEGYSDTEVAKKFKVDRSTLIRWKKRNDVERISNEWKPNIPSLDN